MAVRPNKVIIQPLGGELTLEVTDLYEDWEVGVNYAPNEIVKFGKTASGENRLYEVMQAHTSQADWQPDITASLFKEIGFTETGIALWVQPQGRHDAYAKGAIVSFKDKLWINTIEYNVWAPNIHGWEEQKEMDPVEPNEPPTEIPEWIQPQGSHDAYPLGAFVSYGGKIWENVTPNNVWVPGNYGWSEYEDVVTPPAEPEPVPTPTVAAWKQPTGGHDAYQVDAVVSHKGSVWKNTTANNVWEPGVYGWTVQV